MLFKSAATDETFFVNLCSELSKLGLVVNLTLDLAFILELDFECLKSYGSVLSRLFSGVLTVSRSQDDRP